MDIPAVSPDSSHYATYELNAPAGPARVHVVDVASGRDRVVYQQQSSDRGFFVVLDYENEGVYVYDTGPAGEGARGLWLIGTNGAIQQIAPISQPPSVLGFQMIGGGGAWYPDLAPGDAPPFNGIGPSDRLMRFDLRTKVITPWFRRPGFSVEPLGFDAAGHPIVRTRQTSDGAASTSQQVWLVTAPNVATEIYSGPGSDSSNFLSFIGVPLADSHGIWFGTAEGIYLYTAAGGFRQASTVAGQIAGRCI